MYNRVPLYVKLKEYIYGLICENHDRPDYKLPSENMLCATFSVSRITVKKALASVEEEGYITRVKGSGTYIRQSADISRLAKYAPTPDVNDNDSYKITKKRTLGLILPDINSRYALQIISGVQEKAAAAGWDVILASAMFDSEKEEETVRKLLSSVDALIISPIDYSIYNKEILKLSLKRFPMVVLDNTLKGIDTDAVASDNKKASFDATAYFLNLGKRNIAVVTQPTHKVLTLLERLSGYRQALEAYGLPFNPNLVMETLNNYDVNAINKICAFYDTMPQIDALIAFNYETGVNAIRAAMQRTQLCFTTNEIVIFDEEFEEIYDFLKFDINYIKQDAKKIGVVAFELILEHFSDPTRLRKRIIIKSEFVTHKKQ